MITNNVVYEQTYHILTNNVISQIMSYIKYRMSYVHQMCIEYVSLMPIYIHGEGNKSLYIYVSNISTTSFPSHEGKETSLSTSSAIVWRETVEMTGPSWHAHLTSCWGSSPGPTDTKKVDMNQYLLYVEIKYMYTQNQLFSYRQQIVTL